MSEASPFAVRDRVVVVTGGAGQLGRAFTAALKEAGARVAVIDRVAVAEVDSVLSVACDITDRAALEDALSSIEKAFLTGAKATLKGAFAVDAGSTQFLGPSLASVGLKIPSGGFDLQPGTLTAINAGQIDFTIDQNPYLQGFLPVMYLYLFNLTGGLVAPPNTDTGLTFVTKSNVGPYLNTKTSYEGSAPSPTLVPRSGPIQNPLATTSV